MDTIYQSIVTSEKMKRQTTLQRKEEGTNGYQLPQKSDLSKKPNIFSIATWNSF
jgi:hypothetical protein